MSRWEEDYEIVSDIARGWIGTIVWFYAAIIAYILVILVVLGIAAAVIYHPVFSILAVIGIAWWLATKYTWAMVWRGVRFLLLVVLTVGLVFVGLILAPYLTITVGAGLIVWAVVKGNRRRAAQAAEAARLEQAEHSRGEQEGEADHDAGTPAS